MQELFKNEIYDEAWFKNRAFKVLKPLGSGLWDFSDSVLLYVPSAATYYEAIQKNEDPYSDFFTKPEAAYLQEIAPAVVAELPEEFEYIDLGPGTAHKEQYIFDAAKQAGKHLTIYQLILVATTLISRASTLLIKELSPNRCRLCLRTCPEF